MSNSKKEFSDLDAVTKDLADKVAQINTLSGTYIQLITTMQRSIQEIQTKHEALQVKYNDASDSIQPQINSLKNSSASLASLFNRMQQSIPKPTTQATQVTTQPDQQ